MDRKWMDVNKLSTTYWNGVKNLLSVVFEHTNNPSY